MIGECGAKAAGSEEYQRMSIDIGYKFGYPLALKAKDSTTNYLVYQRVESLINGIGAGLYVYKIHFDPDTADCANKAQKTPATAKVYKSTKYCFPWCGTYAAQVAYSSAFEGFEILGKTRFYPE